MIKKIINKNKIRRRTDKYRNILILNESGKKKFLFWKKKKRITIGSHAAAVGGGPLLLETSLSLVNMLLLF